MFKNRAGRKAWKKLAGDIQRALSEGATLKRAQDYRDLLDTIGEEIAKRKRAVKIKDFAEMVGTDAETAEAFIEGYRDYGGEMDGFELDVSLGLLADMWRHEHNGEAEEAEPAPDEIEVRVTQRGHGTNSPQGSDYIEVKPIPQMKNGSDA